MRWKISFDHIPQFIYESNSERIIEIGPHLPKLSKKIKVARFLATVYNRQSRIDTIS